MTTPRALTIAAAAALLLSGAACTTTVFSGPGFDDGGSGGDGGNGASGATGGTGGNVGGMCAGYEDETSSSVTLTVTNNTGASVYVVAAECELQAYPTVADEAGTPLRYRTSYANCGFTCEALQTTPPICTADACAEPPVIEITAGASYTLGDWDGTFLDAIDMPLECHFDAQGGLTGCDQRLAAPAGAYDMGVQIFPDIVCASELCEPCPATETCEHQGAQVEGEARAAVARMAHPDDATVELFLE